MADKIGMYAYWGGILVAVAAAFATLGPLAGIALFVFGLAAGYLNIKKGESVRGLLALWAAPAAATALAAAPVVGSMVGPILINVALFAGSAAAVVTFVTVHDVLKG